MQVTKESEERWVQSRQAGGGIHHIHFHLTAIMSAGTRLAGASLWNQFTPQERDARPTCGRVEGSSSEEYEESTGGTEIARRSGTSRTAPSSILRKENYGDYMGFRCGEFCTACTAGQQDSRAAVPRLKSYSVTRST